MSVWCPNPGDNTVKVLQNGVSTAAHFFFKMLAFNGNYANVFLHCGIHLCLLQNSNCAANCSPGHQHRAGRSVDTHDRASISVGPFIRTAGHTAKSNTFDPCNKYTSLDQPWRANNKTDLIICDWNFNWNGWYRFFYYGMNIRMTESCVPTSRCGTYYTLWLNGSHPEIEDGAFTRQVCGNAGGDCCLFGSTSIKVKTCPGNYSVYKLSRPNYCNTAYCTDVNTIAPNPQFNPSTIVLNILTYDPCHNYLSLDQHWRANNETGLGICDRDFSWNGWYRLFYYGMNICMPESYVDVDRCGTYYGLWLNGPHPEVEDGVVTRQSLSLSSRPLSSPLSSRSLSSRRLSSPLSRRLSSPLSSRRLSSPVLPFVQPPVQSLSARSPVQSFVQPFVPSPARSPVQSPASSPVQPFVPSPALAFDSVTDPCYNYLSLDQPWRANNETGLEISDKDFNWNGWYRLFYYGMNIRMSESCVPTYRCGAYYTVWLSDSHPQIEDGVVTRQVCGNDGSDCCNIRLNPIRVKACPGSYYVYELVSPFFYDTAYCTGNRLFQFVYADTVTPTAAPTTTATDPGLSITRTTTPTTYSFDPCHTYTVLDDEWRNASYGYWYPNNRGHDDTTVEWKGWYRLFFQGADAQIIEGCVSYVQCGGFTSLWLDGSHPQIEDGIVTRKVYASRIDESYWYRCLLPMPTYCTDVNSITPVNDPEIPGTDSTTTTSTTVTVDPCTEQSCTEEEWCGERDGVYGCFCNQSDPRPRDKSYDSRETCESSSGTMSLSRCQLFEAGFPTNVLHLSDPSCNGTLQNGRLVFHFDNDEHILSNTCLQANGTHFIYENSIQGVADSAGGAINRKKELELRFSCIYKLRQTLTMDTEFSPLQSIVHKTLPDGQGMYQVRMIPYQDAAFSHPYNGTEDIEVDQRIFMEVTVQGVDGRQIATLIDSCWVTPVNDQNYAVRWDLIINRCPNPGDNTVKVLQNGVSTAAHFFFKMLAFNGNYFKVFLHCGIHLCLLQNNNCAVNCSPGHQHRAGRSVDTHDRASISVGPFIRTAGHTGEHSHFTFPLL
ncbi:hypothetical protein NFI96_021550 [Prochilodus magdalenae]|nr:hypothetical protein NFI96_021550 [Prochilodus magdalenae]